MIPPSLTHVLAYRMLIGVANNIVTQWEKFSAWLVGGLAAVLALMLSSLDKGVIDPASVSRAIKIFIALLVLHAVQRIIGTLVGSAGNAMESETKMPVLDLSLEQMDEALSHVEKAYFPPFSWLIKRTFKRIRKGEVLHVSKAIIRMALILTIVMAVQIVLAVWIVVVIAQSIV